MAKASFRMWQVQQAFRRAHKSLLSDIPLSVLLRSADWLRKAANQPVDEDKGQVTRAKSPRGLDASLAIRSRSDVGGLAARLSALSVSPPISVSDDIEEAQQAAMPCEELCSARAPSGPLRTGHSLLNRRDHEPRACVRETLGESQPEPLGRLQNSRDRLPEPREKPHEARERWPGYSPRALEEAFPTVEEAANALAKTGYGAAGKPYVPNQGFQNKWVRWNGNRSRNSGSRAQRAQSEPLDPAMRAGTQRRLPRVRPERAPKTSGARTHGDGNLSWAENGSTKLGGAAAARTSVNGEKAGEDAVSIKTGGAHAVRSGVGFARGRELVRGSTTSNDSRNAGTHSQEGVAGSQT